MARRNTQDPEDFPVTAGNGFAPIPMPSAEVAAQLAATVSQPEPEQLLAPRHDPLAVALRGSYDGKSIQQIVDEFLAALTSHPNAKILTSAFGGTPTAQQQFSDTPLRNQHRVELRFVYRDSVPNTAPEGPKPWKWQALVEASEAPPTGRVAEAKTEAWAYDHLIPKKPKRELAPA